jgi:2'-5' RNA ligase
MQAMTKLVALGVAILPPPDVMARAIACSAALPRDGSERLVLDATHLPHITLTQHVIRYEELDGAYAEIDELLEGLLPLHLTITGGGQSGHTLWMAIERTPALLDLHERLMTALKALERTSADAHAFLDGGGRVADVHWVSGFRQHASFGAFTPHITVGHGAQPPSIEPMEFEATAIAACHLGRFCTCRKILRAWELTRGDEPARPYLPDID